MLIVLVFQDIYNFSMFDSQSGNGEWNLIFYIALSPCIRRYHLSKGEDYW